MADGCANIVLVYAFIIMLCFAILVSLIDYFTRTRYTLSFVGKIETSCTFKVTISIFVRKNKIKCTRLMLHPITQVTLPIKLEFDSGNMSARVFSNLLVFHLSRTKLC